MWEQKGIWLQDVGFIQACHVGVDGWVESLHEACEWPLVWETGRTGPGRSFEADCSTANSGQTKLGTPDVGTREDLVD